MPINPAAIFELVRPRKKWEAYAQNKQNELILAQRSVQLEQARAQQLQAGFTEFSKTMQQMRSLPFEAPDKAEVSKFLMTERDALASSIADNFDSLESFLTNGVSSWAAGLQDRLVNSDVYKNGLSNAANVKMAKDAMQKGEQVIGGVKSGVYKTGENLLADYYQNGGNFSFHGSYKSSSVGKDIYKHFSGMDNPSGKYSTDNSVAPDKVFSYLSASNPELARDFTHRTGGLSGYEYKRYSAEDKAMYELDVLGKQTRINRTNQLMADAAEDKKKQSDLPSYFDATKNSGFASDIIIKSDENNKYYHLFDNVTLGDISDPNGNISFYEHEASAVMPRLLEGAGIKKAEQNTNGYYVKGSYNSVIKNAIAVNNGSAVPLDFKNRSFVVSSNDGKIYMPEAQRRNVNGVINYSSNDAFVKLQISIDDPEVLAKGSIKDKAEKDYKYFKGILGDNIENRNGYYVFDIMMPMQNVWNNQIVNQEGTKKLYGVKEANSANIIPSTSSF